MAQNQYYGDSNSTWWEQVAKCLEKYKFPEDIEEIEKMSKYKWKKLVQIKICNHYNKKRKNDLHQMKQTREEEISTRAPS